MRDSRSPSWLMTGIWLALVGIATTVVAVELLVYVPGQMRMFAEFGVRLPLLSLWVIRVSSFYEEFWLFLVPGALVSLCGMILLLRHAFRLPTLGTVFAVSVLVLHVVAGLMIVVAMAQPMEALREGLSK